MTLTKPINVTQLLHDIIIMDETISEQNTETVMQKDSNEVVQPRGNLQGGDLILQSIRGILIYPQEVYPNVWQVFIKKVQYRVMKARHCVVSEDICHQHKHNYTTSLNELFNYGNQHAKLSIPIHLIMEHI